MKKIFSLFMATMAFMVTLKAQNVQYLPLYTDQNFSKSINTYLPVGKTEGSLNITPTGSATYAIPVMLPPGTKSIMPNVSIAYSSQGGNGNMGMGWNLSSGVSVISRAGKNMHLDNEVSPIKLDYTDFYTLDGNRLVANPDGSFGTKLETFSKITRLGSNSGNPDWFKVETKNGMTYEYGNTTDSKFIDEELTSNPINMMWYVNKAYDQYGNYMEYIYESNGREKRVKEIKYTGNSSAGILPYNSIKFNYQNKTDKVTQYISGKSIESNSLLTEIIVNTEGDARVRRYTFNYGFDDIHSFLREVVEYGSDNYSQLNSTVFKYGTPTIQMQTVSSQGFVGKILSTGDFNGDGLKDILTGENTTVNGLEFLTKLRVYRKNAGDALFTLSFTKDVGLNQLFVTSGHYQSASSLAQDANGDGRDDIILFKISTSTSLQFSTCDYTILQANEDATNFISVSSSSNINSTDAISGFLAANIPTNGSNACWNRIATNSRDNFLQIGDFDGDGRTDFIALLEPCFASTNVVKAVLFTPAKLNSLNPAAPNGPRFSIINIPTSGGAADWVTATRLQVLDFDGDGKTDLMVSKVNGSSITRKVYTFRPVVISNPPYLEQYADEIYSQTFLNDKIADFKLGDFNGDGKTDLVGLDVSTNSLCLYISTGKILIKTANFIPYTPVQIPNGTYEGYFDIGDFNGDGLSDVLVNYNQTAQLTTRTYNNKIRNIVFFSSGNSFVSKEFPLSRSFNTWSSKGTWNEFTFGDFNGDNKTDYYSKVHDFERYDYDINSFNSLAKNNALEKVTDGFNNTSTIGYKYLTEGSSIYTKNLTSSYPLNVVQAPIMVVSSVTTPDGIGGVSTATYKYENAKLHRAGVGFLGFTTFQQDNTIQDGRSITEFEILTPQYLTAVKKQTTKQISNNTILSELTNTNNVTVNGNRYWQKTQGYEDKNLLTGATKGVWRSFDANGNITDESYDIVGVEQGTTSMGNFNTFGQPGYVFSYKKRFETPNLDYTWSSKSYDAKGALNWETFDQYDYNIGWQNTSITYYDYYQNVGLPKSTTLTSPGLPTKTTTISSYDSKWRFATKMTNPLGQSSTKTYDARWGTVLTETLLAETGVTGLTTTNYYDAFGKLTTTVTPQGINITKQYLWYYPHLNLPKKYEIVTTTPGRPSTWDSYDIFGRQWRSTTENYGSPNTRWTYSYSVKEFDAKGNVVKQSTPVNGDEWAQEVEYQTFEFDALNRLKSSSNPTIGTTSYTYAYNAGKTTVTMTSPAGQVSLKVTDATGKVVSTTDYGGTLNFEYDNKGNQTAVKLGSTVLTSMTYDYRGNQTALTDKNAGTTQYRYNAYGELEWQKDAMNTEYTMTYDIMGRLVTRYSLVEGLTTNEYLTSGNGLNQIKKVTGINGINQEYVYDAQHRVSQVKETIDGTVYTKSFTYNIYNDIETTTYPSGLVIKNSYSDDGFLFKVEQNNGQILFDGTDGTMNGYGKWKNYKLGNVATDIQYNHWAMPQNIKGGGGSIQNLLLDWNLQTGNLNYRYDVRKYKYESFTYDNQNRLRSATVSGLPEQSYIIDDIGNIKSKTGVGAYFYHPTKIHVVEDIKNPQGVMSIVPSMQQDIIYTKYHRVEKITEGVNELSFVYASDYERRKTVLKQNNVVVDTRYFMGDYEIDIKNGVTRHIHYIGGGDGLCAIVVKEGSADFNFFFTYKDHLGSILTVTDKFGGIVAEQNFDAWGRKRNFTTWDYAGVQSVPDWLYRGFTGHEHLAEFGLINMNARLYDPILGRMLSPDNLVGSGSQGFNRYSYANNNPLKFVDPDGNWAHIVIGAVIGGAVNLWQHWDKIDNLGDGLLAFGIGAGAGALGAATGGYAAAALKLGTTGAISGAVTGFVGGGIGSTVKQVGNVIAFGGDKYGDKFSFGEVGLEAIGGGLFGGVIGGGVALFKGQNFWWGNTPASTRIAAGLFKETWEQGFRTEATEYSKTTSEFLKPSIEELEDVRSLFSGYSSETAVVTTTRAMVNSNGVPYPKFFVSGYGNIPFPKGPYTPNNSGLRPSEFTVAFKERFKDWWLAQGRSWPSGAVEIHHIQPLAHGGRNVFENLVPLNPADHLIFTNWWRATLRQ
jgi:RHS repeat-associated protein